MALNKTLIYIALALAVMGSIEAGRGRGSGGRGGPGGFRSGRGRGGGPDISRPCWFQDIAADPVEPAEDSCGDPARAICDTADYVSISDDEGTELYRVGFCKPNVTALLIELGSGNCADDEEAQCFGPYTIGDANDRHFCGCEGEEFGINEVRPCRPDHSRGSSSSSESSEERRNCPRSTTTALP